MIYIYIYYIYIYILYIYIYYIYIYIYMLYIYIYIYVLYIIYIYNTSANPCISMHGAKWNRAQWSRGWMLPNPATVNSAFISTTRGFCEAGQAKSVLARAEV